MDNFSLDDQAFDLAAAQLYLNENRHEEAIKMAEARLKQAPGDIEAKIILCQGLLRLGKLERLQILLREIDATISKLSQVYRHLGELCRRSGLNTEADNFLNKYESLKTVLAVDGQSTEVSAPVSPVSEGDDEPADDMRPDANIAPEFYTLTLVELYLRQGHPDQAREVLETILAKEPGNEQAAIKLAELNKILTEAEAFLVSETELAADKSHFSASLVTKLEGWLARVEQLRSPGI